MWYVGDAATFHWCCLPQPKRERNETASLGRLIVDNIQISQKYFYCVIWGYHILHSIKVLLKIQINLYDSMPSNQ
ncbi:MAG: hypothetical protein Q4A56_06165 [Porphyromonadaceae bacterium]|nr:hypothetical protein [Porphyromonadaceae bacterium]